MSCPYFPNADRYKLTQTLLGPMEPKCIGFLIISFIPLFPDWISQGLMWG